MTSHIRRLGKLQEKILKHIVECGNIEQIFVPPETVSHIAESLGCSQPTIFKSVKILLEHHYLDSIKCENRYDGRLNLQNASKTGGVKILFVTAKGAAAAIVYGVNIDKLEKYLKYIVSYRFYPRPVMDGSYIDSLKREYLKHSLDNPIDYDDIAKIVKLCEPTAMILDYMRRIAEPHTKLDLIIKKTMTYALENRYFEEDDLNKQSTSEKMQKLRLFIALQHLDVLGNIPTLKEFVNKYGIDKDFLKKHLRRQREYINSAIKELN
jgi:DNA-binding Lrp family transcriptional regulator